MVKKILIIGGVAGGAGAAARLRRLSEDFEITIFEKGGYISFANCGLPYYIGGEIEERDNLFLQTPESFKNRFNVDVKVNHEVISVDIMNKCLQVKDLISNTTMQENYDALVLSPGSVPVVPNIPGISSENIFTIWNVSDVDKIYEYMKHKKPRTAVIVGGGFIGIEMMENLYLRGLDVTIIEAGNQLLPPIDFDMACTVENYLINKKVKVLLNEKAESFEYKQTHTEVKLSNGQVLSADIIIWCAGVKPNTEFLKSSGILLNSRGGIVVDEYLNTNIENVYAVGDAIEVTDFIEKNKTMIPLAGPANKQARIVADNIMGGKVKYKGTQGTSIVKVFDMTVASTGHNEKQLKKSNTDYIYSITDSISNASYYPGGRNMNIKLIYNQEGKIFGAQIVGYTGVDKRIDVLATVIRLNGSVYDLIELELAYAPPFSSAKDPVNMIGYVASNVLENKLRMAYWDEIENVDFNKTIILDVREKMEYESGHIEGAVHIPLNTLRKNLDKLSKDKEVIVYCAVGLRAYLACRILSNEGFTKVRDLTGGFKFYNIVTRVKKIYSN